MAISFTYINLLASIYHKLCQTELYPMLFAWQIDRNLYLTSAFFLDVVLENINYDTKASFVIERVFERGDVQDIRNCRHYYGDKKVTEVLLNA